MSELTTTSQPVTSSPLKRLINGHPLVAYFVLAFAGTWLLFLPLVLGKNTNGLGLLPFTIPFPLFVVLFLLSSYAGPTLAAFLVTAVTEGKPGVRHLLRRYVQWRVGIRWYLFVFFGYLVLFLVATSIFLGAAPFSALIQNWPLLFTVYLPAILVFPGIITWGEEPGWRGFALPRLQQRYGPLLGSLILGFLHGVWHLPAYFTIQLGPFSLLSYATNVLNIMMVTLLWTWVFNNTKGSILLAVLNHAAFNASQALLAVLVPVLPLGGWIEIAALGVVVVLIIIFTKGRLSYKPNRGLWLPADVPLTQA